MSCFIREWSQPKMLADQSPPPIARFPSIAVGSLSTFIVGNNLPSLSLTATTSDLLTAWELGRGSIGRPRGDFVFAFPKAAIDLTGRLHLLWAEPNEEPEPRAEVRLVGLRLQSIWTASYTRDQGWTAPSRVYAGRVAWDDVASDNIARGGTMLALAVPKFVTEQGLLLLQFNGERWTAQTILTTFDPAYASVGISGQQLYVGFIAAAGGKDRNSVLLVKSNDLGATWSDPRIVSRSGANAAYDLKLRIAIDATLHLVWLQTSADGERALRHVDSHDGGLTWSAVADLPVSDGFNTPDVAIDECGDLHVVFEDYPGRGPVGHIAYVQWSGRWSHVTPLFADLDASDPSIAVLPGHKLLSLAVARERPNDTTARLVTRYVQSSAIQRKPTR